MAIETYGKKIFNVIQLVPYPSSHVVDLGRGATLTDFTHWVFQ